MNKSLAIFLTVLAISSACTNQVNKPKCFNQIGKLNNILFKKKSNIKNLTPKKRSLSNVRPLAVANKANKELNWLEQGLIYQIYPRSFQDSNGDGIGDLQGKYYPNYILCNYFDLTTIKFQ